MISFLGHLIYVVFVLVILYCTIHTFGTFLVYWMESQLAYWRDTSKSAPNLMVTLRAAGIEFLCNFARCCLLPFGRLYAKSTALNVSSHDTPILLVHGYSQNQSYWYWFQYQLKNWGFSPIYTLNLGNQFSSIESHAETLAKKIKTIQETHPNQAITLIGHSMGGLVSAYYTENLAEPQTIGKVITLGSPFHGTRLAGLGLGLNAQEMAPDSPFLQKLRPQIKASSVPYYHIASQLDNLIVPWDSALPGYCPEREKVLDSIGHLQLLVSSEVLETVKSWLEEDPS